MRHLSISVAEMPSYLTIDQGVFHAIGKRKVSSSFAHCASEVFLAISRRLSGIVFPVPASAELGPISVSKVLDGWSEVSDAAPKDGVVQLTEPPFQTNGRRRDSM